MSVRIIIGDALTELRGLPDESAHCCVTSPPYWGLRDYGVAGQLGLEPDYRLYVERLVEIMREVWRVLRRDGTLWLNLGDCYATGAGLVGSRPGGGEQGDRWAGLPGSRGHRGQHLPNQSGLAAPRIEAMGPMTQPNRMPQPGLKPKDLVGIPWRVAFALQEGGWYLRQDIIWSKPNPMPESVTDRCTKAHEYLFLLSKSERYHYDAAAIRESQESDRPDMAEKGLRTGGAYINQSGPQNNSTAYRRPNSPQSIASPHGQGFTRRAPHIGEDRKALRSDVESRHRSTIPGGQSLQAEPTFSRNKRSVWTVATAPFSEAHFATFPPALIEPCIKAGCPEGGTVLDPFGGAGTTGLVADRLGRNAVLVELNPAYAEMARQRIYSDAPLFVEVA